jgi:subtilase family serine protease
MNQLNNSVRHIQLFDTLAYVRKNPLTILSMAIMALLAIVTPQTVAAQSQPLIGNHPGISTTSMTSPADASQSLNINISFARRNPAALAKLLADLQNPASPNYHKWLSPKEFATRFGRSAKEIDAVRQWLSAQGMRVITSSSRGIAATATVAQAEATFATSMIASPDGSVFANTSDPQIPTRFAGVIGSIEGLDNTRHSLAMALRPPHSNAPQTTSPPARHLALRPYEPRAQKAPAGSLMLVAVSEYSGGAGVGFGPADLWTFYDETSLLNGGTNGAGGDCVALVEDTDYLSSAVTLFNTNFSLPVPTITRVQASGSSPGINGDEIEALLDIEWAHAVAPGASIYVYIGNGASGLEDAM